MPKKYVVDLDAQQRRQLQSMLGSGRDSARKLARARVLLKSDAGENDEEIQEALGLSVRTVERVRQRFTQGGLQAALEDRPQPPRPQKRKIDGQAEAKLVTLACSKPPEGHEHWTLQLLADQMVHLHYVAGSVSYQTVRRVLKKTCSSRG